MSGSGRFPGDSEIAPLVIISPNEMNGYLRTVQVVLDQIRAVDKSGLMQRPGDLDKRAMGQVSSLLLEMFAA